MITLSFHDAWEIKAQKTCQWSWLARKTENKTQNWTEKLENTQQLRNNSTSTREETAEFKGSLLKSST